MKTKIIIQVFSVYLFILFLVLPGFSESSDSAQRTYTSKWTPRRNIASIDVGGSVSFIQAGYNYEYTDTLWGEDMTISDCVENADALGFSAGAGFYIVESLEIAAHLNIFSKSLNGVYGFSLPNIYLWDDIASDEEEANPFFRATVFSFIVNFHPVTSGSFRPFVGAGVSYISGKMDLLYDIIYEETIYWDWTHDIDIVEIEFEETNVNKLGFNFSGGMDFYITNRVAFYASGRYIIAKREVEHPLTTQWEEGETIELNLGGLSANLGIKVFF
jgi:opacity protein-like surface antigen